MDFYFGMMPRNAGTAPDGCQANWFKYIWDFNSYEDGSGLPRGEDAFGSGATIGSAGGTTHDFTVRYYDQTGIDPATLDSSDVDVRGPGGTASTAADASRKTLGASSIRFETAGGFDTWLSFPPADAADWDLTSATNLYFDVYAENDETFQENSPWIRLRGDNGGYFDYRYHENGNPSDPLNTALTAW